MRKGRLSEWISLDVVVQSAGADDDTSNHFARCGWHVEYMEETAMNWLVSGLTDAGRFLFGRRTYELLASYWPNARDDEAALAEPPNQKPKYVAATTLNPPLDWAHITLLEA